MSDDGSDGLKRFCSCLVEFMSETATDPHLYFQSKLTADIAAARDLDAVSELADQLTAWVESIGPESSSVDQLNDRLAAQELPSYSMMNTRDNRKAGRILARGLISTDREYDLVRSVIDEAASLTDNDRELARRLISKYANE